jgi:hypothetical protein
MKNNPLHLKTGYVERGWSKKEKKERKSQAKDGVRVLQ